MNKRFRWNEWNRYHIARHGVTEAEAEYVVRHASPPYPRPVRDGKLVVWGRTQVGRQLQVMYVVDDPENFDFENASLSDILELGEEALPRFYVIHARDLTQREKSSNRRGR